MSLSISTVSFCCTSGICGELGSISGRGCQFPLLVKILLLEFVENSMNFWHIHSFYCYQCELTPARMTGKSCGLLSHEGNFGVDRLRFADIASREDFSCCFRLRFWRCGWQWAKSFPFFTTAGLVHLLLITTSLILFEYCPSKSFSCTSVPYTQAGWILLHGVESALLLNGSNFMLNYAFLGVSSQLKLAGRSVSKLQSSLRSPQFRIRQF